MFTARTEHDGGTLLVLGLSRENCRRLLKGQPISVTRESHGMAVPEKLRVFIFGGEDEAELMRAMRTLIGPDTVVDQLKPL